MHSIIRHTNDISSCLLACLLAFDFAGWLAGRRTEPASSSSKRISQ